MNWNSVKVNQELYIEKFYTFFETDYDSTYNFKGESHNFWECVYVTEGTICVSADERVYNLKSGEIIIHQPLEFHKFYITSENGAHLVIFSFDLEGELSSFLRQKVVMLSKEEKQIMQLLLNYIRGNKETNDFNFLQYVQQKSDFSGYMQTVTSYIYLLLLSLVNSKNTGRVSTDYNSKIFEKAINYMNDNLYSKVLISEIASFCNISPTVLKSIFKKYSGISIHKYFVNMKMRKAVEMLKNGYNVTEVSMQLGFCSQPYFTSAFKREFGVLPTDAKKVRP